MQALWNAIGWRRSKTPLRRLMTFAGVLCVSLAPFESLVADVHDNLSTIPAVCSADDTCDAQEHASLPSDGSGRDTHRFHVDHCAHSHLAAVPLRDGSGRANPPAHRDGIGEPCGLHESIVLPPQQRPPIA